MHHPSRLRNPPHRSLEPPEPSKPSRIQRSLPRRTSTGLRGPRPERPQVEASNHFDFDMAFVLLRRDRRGSHPCAELRRGRRVGRQASQDARRQRAPLPHRLNAHRHAVWRHRVNHREELSSRAGRHVLRIPAAFVISNVAAAMALIRAALTAPRPLTWRMDGNHASTRRPDASAIASADGARATSRPEGPVHVPLPACFESDVLATG